MYEGLFLIIFSPIFINAFANAADSQFPVTSISILPNQSYSLAGFICFIVKFCQPYVSFISMCVLA